VAHTLTLLKATFLEQCIDKVFASRETVGAYSVNREALKKDGSGSGKVPRSLVQLRARSA
jgi:hypothetical protein